MGTRTTLYRLDKPTVGGDADAWGGSLNSDMDQIDTMLGAIATAGSSNAYTLTTGQSLTAYVNGQTFTVRASFANTGAATMNWDSLGAKNLRKLVGGTLTALASGDIASGDYLRVSYNSASDVIVIHGLLASMAQAADATLTALAAMAWTSGTLLVSLTAADTITLQADSGYIHTTGNESLAGKKTFTGAGSSSPRSSGTDAAWELMNAALNQNWYFGIKDSDSNKLYIGRGHSPAQGITPSVSVTTGDVWTFTQNPLGASSAPICVSGKIAIPIPASAMVANTTNGAASGTTETTTNRVMLRSLDFDQTTQEGAQFEIIMPKSWNESTVSFQPVWTAASGSGGVVWELRAQAQSDDDVLDGTWGTGQTSTDTLIATTDRHIGPESSAITIGGTPAEGDTVVFQIRRNVADASDTLTADARLLGIRLFITTNAANDA